MFEAFVNDDFLKFDIIKWFSPIVNVKLTCYFEKHSKHWIKFVSEGEAEKSK